MSLTFLAKSSAYSWKMSFWGQVLCHRMVMGPCALATVGAVAAAAAPAAMAAPLRKDRRVCVAVSFTCSLIGVLLHRGVIRPFGQTAPTYAQRLGGVKRG